MTSRAFVGRSWDNRGMPGPESFDLLVGQMHELMPDGPPVARVEVGEAVFDWLKTIACPEGAPPENPWRQLGYVPQLPGGSLFGVPVVLGEGLSPRVWRLIDRGGEVVNEGSL
jgi:hypothetical protein